MKIYTVGSQKVISTWNEVGLIESGLPQITYPYSFTTKMFSVEQAYICRADQVPQFVHGTSHSLYPASKAVSQSSATISSTGFATFTRKFLNLPNSTLTIPSTSAYTFPSISFGINYQKRNIKEITTTQTGQNGDQEQIVVPSPTAVYFRRFPVTKTIPVFEELEFIYLGSSFTTESILASQVGVGNVISGRTVTGIDSNEIRIIFSFDSGADQYYDPDGTVQITVPLVDPSKIQVDEAFKIFDRYGENFNQNAEVGFIDDMTTPSRVDYLDLVDDNPRQLLFTSQIDHIEGLVYVKKNIYGDLI